MSQKGLLSVSCTAQVTIYALNSLLSSDISLHTRRPRDGGGGMHDLLLLPPVADCHTTFCLPPPPTTTAATVLLPMSLLLLLLSAKLLKQQSYSVAIMLCVPYTHCIMASPYGNND